MLSHQSVCLLIQFNCDAQFCSDSNRRMPVVKHWFQPSSHVWVYNMVLHKHHSTTCQHDDLAAIIWTFCNDNVVQCYKLGISISALWYNLGELRWKKTEPVEPWTDVFDATTDTRLGVACIQNRAGVRTNFNMSEDCLTLNVYTPSKKCYCCFASK